MLKIAPKFVQKIRTLLFSFYIFGETKTVLLITLFLFCNVSCQITPDRSQAKPEIITDNLPLALRWSKSMPQASGDDDNLACYQDVGVFLSNNYSLDSNWRGLVVFDQDGNSLWNKPEHSPFATFLDNEKVIVFDVPRLYAYDSGTGELLWKTQDGLTSRLNVHEIYLKDDTKLFFSSSERLNEYQFEDGILLYQENFTTQDFLLRHEGIDVYGTHDYLEATIASDRENKLWTLTSGPWGSPINIPVSYEDNIIVRFAKGPREFCSIKLDNGQFNWCNDSALISNIVIKKDVGFGITIDDELIAFDLNNGEEIGKVIFSPPTTHGKNGPYRLAVCEEHMLVFMTSIEELFWFDFVSSDK